MRIFGAQKSQSVSWRSKEKIKVENDENDIQEMKVSRHTTVILSVTVLINRTRSSVRQYVLHAQIIRGHSYGDDEISAVVAVSRGDFRSALSLLLWRESWPLDLVKFTRSSV